MKKIVLAGALAALFGCGGGGDGGTPPANQAPDTGITREISEDGGSFKAYVTGVDPDGLVTKIRYRVNGGPWAEGQYPATPPFELDISDVIEGDNIVEAVAIDNNGLEDPTPATNTYHARSEAEARAVIEAQLGAKGRTYIRDAVISLGNEDIVVDYLIIEGPINNPTYRAINFRNLGENYSALQGNKALMDTYWGPGKNALFTPKNVDLATDVLAFIGP